MIQYHPQIGRVLGVALVSVALCVPLLNGCTTAKQGNEASDNEFIGQPPPPDEDPFSVRGDVRAEAVAADPRGEISEGDFEEPTPRDDLEARPEEWDEALGGGDEEAAEAAKAKDEPEDASETASKPEPESSKVASRTAEGESADETRPKSTSVRCFSCVKICPIEGDCASAKKDVICGWGAHSTRDQAARLARAECDATLDMARQMPVWSRIEGSCPAATCSQ